ncbi:hypothetical protein GGI15_002225 [Coemansia interrupta]|uniref:Uncharacterized protein n=1 Tax=Coemansia interrupta TaxID=1126814 RepID=A0A9W8LJQ7_9FUNG|nr:hypothetical protein GGI15_002225 [Coemansia interrupta]
MDTAKFMSKPKRSSSSPTRPLLFSRIEVQCTDPDLKREALSELFDHCMTPIAATHPISRNQSGSVSPRAGSGSNGLRARPLSAAPLLDLDLTNHLLSNAPVSINSGLMSPVTLSNDDDEALFDSRLQGNSVGTTAISGGGNSGDDDICVDDDEYDDDDDEEEYGAYECVGSFKQPPTLGTFADLRRKLYGSDLTTSLQTQT